MKRAFWFPRSRRRIDAEVTEEFRFHIEERIEQFVANGMSRDEAAREVRRRFGDYDAHRDLTRRIDEDGMEQQGRRELGQTIVREFGLALRALRRTPGFSLVAMLTLVLGIGATTAIFTVLDAVVLRPLGYRQPEQLVAVRHPATVPGSGERHWGLSLGGYFQFLQKNRSFSSFGLYRNSGMVVTNGGEAELVKLGMTTASLFDVLKARPAVGRLLDAGDDRPGAPKRVVLSYEYFQRRFGGDRAVIGRNLETSDDSYEIVGVTEPGLVLPLPGAFSSSANLAALGVDVWVAIKPDPAGPFYNNHPWVGLGRLRPGVTVAEAQTDLERIFADFPSTVPNAYSRGFIDNYNFRIEASPLQATVLGPKIPRTLWMLFGAVALVLLIATANVSNLFLVRLEARRRESAIRAALGADRIQMAAHYLAESLLVCLVAALLAIGVAQLGLRALLAIAPTDIPRLATASISSTSVLVALGIGLVLGVTLGVLPGLRRTIDLGVLREGGRGLSSSLRQRTVRRALVVGQIALAMVLLAAAGLMLRSFSRLRDVRPGFDASNTLVFDLTLPYRDYGPPEKALVFHRELQRRIGELPGVVSVGAVGAVPLEGYGTGCSVVAREKRPYQEKETTPCVATPMASPGFLETLRIPVEGRMPTWTDVDQRTHAVVVTKTLADRLWPGEDPIGKGINSNGPDADESYRVVGVIPELRAEGFDLPPTEAVFYAVTSLKQNRDEGRLTDLSYLVRTDGSDPFALTGRIREIIASLDARVPLIDVRSMAGIVRASTSRVEFLVILLGTAAAVALLLSAVGLYGVVSYVVAQRRSEIGIRMALGATVREVVTLVFAQSATLAATGIAIGLVGAVAVTRLLSSLLYEVSPTDPVVLASVVMVLLVITLLASIVPARRAAGVDPAETMREG